MLVRFRANLVAAPVRSSSSWKPRTANGFTAKQSNAPLPTRRSFASEVAKKSGNETVGSYEPDFSNYKKTTGLVGLPALPPKTARMMLIKACERVLEEVAKDIPPEAGYRVLVEQTFKERLRVANEHLDPRIIEAEIDCGQIEELIIQAEDELSLIPDMRKNKPWEVAPGYKVPVVVRVSNPRLKDKHGTIAGTPNPFLKAPK